MWIVMMALPCLASTAAWIGAEPPTSAQARQVQKLSGDALAWTTRADLVGQLEDQANLCAPTFDVANVPNTDWVALDVDGDVVVWRVDSKWQQLNRHEKSWAASQRSMDVVLVDWPERGVPTLRAVAKAVDGPVTPTRHPLSNAALQQLMEHPYECVNPAVLAVKELSGVEGPVYVAVEAKGRGLFVWRWEGGDEPLRLVSR